MLSGYFIYPAEQVSVTNIYRVCHVANPIILISLIGQYDLWYGWVQPLIRLGAVKLKKFRKLSV
jgi:hypothetical protein